MVHHLQASALAVLLPLGRGEGLEEKQVKCEIKWLVQENSQMAETVVEGTSLLEFLEHQWEQCECQEGLNLEVQSSWYVVQKAPGTLEPEPPKGDWSRDHDNHDHDCGAREANGRTGS